jgi:hypothetical protein
VPEYPRLNLTYIWLPPFCAWGRRTLSPDGPFTTHIFLFSFANTKLQHVTNCMAHRSIIICILTSSIQSVSSPLASLSPLTRSLHLIILSPSDHHSSIPVQTTGLYGSHGQTRHCIIVTRIIYFMSAICIMYNVITPLHLSIQTPISERLYPMIKVQDDVPWEQRNHYYATSQLLKLNQCPSTESPHAVAVSQS